MWTTRTATGRSWLGGEGLGKQCFLWWLVGLQLGGVWFWTCDRGCVLCAVCFCACVCFWGCSCALQIERNSTTKEPGRASSLAQALMWARGSSCGGGGGGRGAVRGGGGRGCGGEGRLAIPRVFVQSVASQRRHVPGPVQECRILQAVQKSSLCKNIERERPKSPVKNLNFLNSCEIVR